MKANSGLSPGDRQGDRSNFIARILEAGFLDRFIYGVLLFIFFLSGFLSCWKGLYPTGIGFIAGGLTLAFAKSIFKNLRADIQFGLAALGALLIAESFSAVHDFAEVMPQGLLFNLPNWHGFLFIVGFVLILMGSRFSSRPPFQEPEVKSWQVGLILGCVAAVAAWIALSHLNDPPGFYWDDNATVIKDIRTVKELHLYGIIMPASFREPAITYWTAMLWYLFPDATGIQMQRIGPVFMFLASLGMMYLLGKEVAGRKVGLIFAAIGAVNKWLLTETVWGSGLILTMFSVSWSLLMLYRIFKNPSWFNFILWGLALTFGTYTYGAYRPYDFLMVLVVGIWILAARKKWSTNWAGWFLAFWVSGFWLSFFLEKNHLILNRAGFDLFSQNWFLWVYFVLFFLALVLASVGFFEKKGQNGIFLKLTAGLSLAAILVYPLVTHPAYGMRVAELNAFQAGNDLGAKLATFLVKFGKTFRELFMGAGFWGDSAFDFQGAWVVVVGVAVFLAKPSWKTFLLFAAIVVGLVPHVLTHDEYNGRALASVTPFLLLGALGIEEIRVWGGNLWGRKMWNRFFTALFCLFLGWQAWDSYEIIFQKWFYMTGPEALVSREVVEDSPANRVYLTVLPNCSSPECQGVLDEGHPLYVYRDSNPIYVKPGEKPKDVVLIFFPGDPKLEDRLKKEFPLAQWTSINFNTFHYPTVQPGDTATRFYRVFIPADQISTNPARSIYFAPGLENGWTRDFYIGSYGMGHGAIAAEDMVKSLRQPFPVNDMHSAGFTGVFQAPVDGDYQFSMRDQNFVLLWIDGHKALDARGAKPQGLTASKTIHLTKGAHSIYLVSYFLMNQLIPNIAVRVPGENQDQELDDFTASK